jgi:hypothetical protein
LGGILRERGEDRRGRALYCGPPFRLLNTKIPLLEQGFFYAKKLSKFTIIRL